MADRLPVADNRRVYPRYFNLMDCFMQRFLIGLVVLSTIFGSAEAQTQSQSQTRSTYEAYRARRQAAYRDFRRQRQQAYDDFRARRNAEYAAYMERRWTAYRTMAGIEEPAQPQPVPQPINEAVRNVPPVDYEIRVTTAVPPVSVPTASPVSQPDASPVSRPAPQPVPSAKPEPKPAPDVAPAPQPVPAPAVDPTPTNPARPTDADRRTFAFSFYGTPCRLNFTEQMRFRLGGLSEQQVAKAWNTLADGRCEQLAEELQQLREELRLGDWGYLKLVRTACEAFYGAAADEAVVMELYLLTQADLKVRAACSEANLQLLFCPNEEIFALPFFEIGGERFYVADKSRVKGGYRVFDREYPGERPFSMRMTALPALAERVSSPRTIRSKRFPEAEASVGVNRNLLDFMTDYPSCRWDMYAVAGLSESVKAQLYPALKQAIAGRDEKTAVDLLLDFIQTGLAYKTDPEQFGRERSLFADESCYYPYCDCEDRAILLAVLVHDLLGLEVVLLNYPEHVSTAVCFRETVEGDYFNYGGKRYVCCDPSYIGASSGRSMPDYKNVSPTIIRIRN